MASSFFGGGPSDRFLPFSSRNGFIEVYRCNSMAIHGKEEKEHGDKIILPNSALDKLVRLYISYPMQFELRNASTTVDLTVDEPSSAHPLRTHVGVLEFNAPEGRCFVPHWIMQNLLIKEGDFIQVKNVTLPLATFIKFRPRSEDFFEISNSKAVLENTLRNFSCVTKNDQICFPYNGRKYYLDIVDVKPQDSCGIIEADVNVEFDNPPGYEEKIAAKKEAENALASSASATSNVNPVNTHEKKFTLEELENARKMRESQLQAYDSGYMPFSGVGRRIDDRTSKYEHNPSFEDSNKQTTSSVRIPNTKKWKTKTQATAFSGKPNSLR